MKKRLRDIAEIQAGYQFRGRVEADPDGNMPVIQMKDMDTDRRLNAASLSRIKLDHAPDNCRATGRDVLFLSRGNRLTATTVPAAAEGALVSGMFFILRPRVDMIRPTFLAWFINQPSFQSQLQSCVRGTGVAIMAKADLQDLWVLVPPIEKQERIVMLDDLFAKERKQFAELADKRSQLLHALCIQDSDDGF